MISSARSFIESGGGGMPADLDGNLGLTVFGAFGAPNVKVTHPSNVSTVAVHPLVTAPVPTPTLVRAPVPTFVPISVAAAIPPTTYNFEDWHGFAPGVTTSTPQGVAPVPLSNAEALAFAVKVGTPIIGTIPAPPVVSLGASSSHSPAPVLPSISAPSPVAAASAGTGIILLLVLALLIFF